MPRTQLDVLADALSVFEARRALCESISAWQELAHDGALEAELEVTAAHLRALARCDTLRMRSDMRVRPSKKARHAPVTSAPRRCVAGNATADRGAC